MGMSKPDFVIIAYCLENTENAIKHETSILFL